jgi:hypothetical protein
MRTPIELLIFQLQYSYNLNPNPSTASAIEYASNILSLEKEHLRGAYLSGSLTISEGTEIPFESFYTEKYTKP